MRYTDPDGRDIRDYIRREKSAIRCGYLVGGILGAIARNELVMDHKAKGTYNYGESKVGHAIKDVLPWILLGTGRDDSSTMRERLLNTLKAAPDFIKGLINKEAE